MKTVPDIIIALSEGSMPEFVKVPEGLTVAVLDYNDCNRDAPWVEICDKAVEPSEEELKATMEHIKNYEGKEVV